MRERVKSHLFSTFFAPITFELRFRSVSIGILAILPVRILYASAIDEAGAWDNYSTKAIFSHLIDLFAILQAAIVQHVLNGKFTYQNTTLLLPHKTQIQMAFQWSVQIDEFAYSTWSWAFHNANFILCCFFLLLCVITRNGKRQTHSGGTKEIEEEQNAPNTKKCERWMRTACSY